MVRTASTKGFHEGAARVLGADVLQEPLREHLQLRHKQNEARLTALRGDEAVLVTGMETIQVIFDRRDRGLNLRERVFRVVKCDRFRLLELLSVLGVSVDERGCRLPVD